MGPAVPDLAALYGRHRETMFRVAYDRLRSSGREGEADDVVHDVVVSVMKSTRNGDIDDWEAFLVRAVINRVKDRVKSAAWTRDGGPIEDQLEPADSSNLEDDVVEAVVASRKVNVLRESLSVLEPNEHRVLWESVALERPGSELASELGVSAGRISQLKKQGCTKLRAEMERREEADG